MIKQKYITPRVEIVEIDVPQLMLVASGETDDAGTGKDPVGDETEDLISIGTIGLIKGINTFKSDKGIRLATYAARCIENATLSQMSFSLRKELPIGELPSRLQKICI